MSLSSLDLDAADRRRLWRDVVNIIERHHRTVCDLDVAPTLDPDNLRQSIEAFLAEAPQDPTAALSYAAERLSTDQVHTPHPRYFGLFNPAPSSMGIAADALVAAFNPQLAAWSHSPFAAEVEAFLVREVGVRLGYDSANVDGTFASGGAEANHTGVLCALEHSFPSYRTLGAASIDGPPVAYITSESHDTFVKAAGISGIGHQAMRIVPTTPDWRMDPDALSQAIEHDRASGAIPFAVIGTAGTTGAGIVDPLDRLASVAARNGLWLHVDAAWGGAAAFAPALRTELRGLDRADSITIDAHKWLSVPMGAGLFLTKHPDILSQTFGTPNAYMPRDAEGLKIVDPFSHSIQWSRRFIGLKLLLTLAVTGWEGYANTISHQAAMGDLLRRRLQEEGWHVVNHTKLPVVCFTHPCIPQGDRGPTDLVVQSVVRTGRAWISTAILGGSQPVLRACITNYRTQEEDIEALVHVVNEKRAQLAHELKQASS